MGGATDGGETVSNNPEIRSRRIPEDWAIAMVDTGASEPWGHADLERRTLALLLSVAKRLSDELRRWHESRGVPTFAQATLGALSDCTAAGGISPTVLAAKLAITTGTMTHRLDALERHGFVIRQREGHDGRRRLVLITSKGHKVLEKLREQQIAFEADLMRSLDPSQTTALGTLLLELRDKTESS